MHVVTVPANADGMRLDRFLTEYFEESEPASTSRAAVQKLIAGGLVKLNKQTVKPSARLRPADLVEIGKLAANPSSLAAQDLPLAVLFEDPDIIVVNKAAGMVVHPAAGQTEGTLVNALLHHCPSLEGIGGERRPGIVHRLDKDTSGVMVVAKNASALESLARQFRERTVAKEYLALVWGWLPGERGTVDRAVGRHRSDRKKMSSLFALPHKRNAVTEWQVEARFRLGGEAMSLLRLKPHTGRTHQLRVHMADMKFPLVGDAVYGGKAFQNKNKEVAACHGLVRQALHAERLAIAHPRSAQRMVFSAPMAEDMRGALAAVGA